VRVPLEFVRLGQLIIQVSVEPEIALVSPPFEVSIVDLMIGY